MLLIGKCRKCDAEVTLNIGRKSLEEVRENLKRMESFQCPGKHVELSSPYPSYWNIDNWAFEEGVSLSEEDFVADLKDKYTEVIDTDEMIKRGVIKSFSYGIPITSDGFNWNYAHSPKGKRWYFR